MTNFLVKLTS